MEKKIEKVNKRGPTRTSPRWAKRSSRIRTRGPISSSANSAPVILDIEDFKKKKQILGMAMTTLLELMVWQGIHVAGYIKCLLHILFYCYELTICTSFALLLKSVICFY
ncbi:PREDICTED: uncharacterized protein LOC104787347 [Camelina sativa]|uniref:Uncharacterized protein LOC104787347 n=1 Tax=Camelina sativa TaxID=90675 RepID=A0ABM0Z6S2_CAMSA|nr:PREDICTED: uncharacterized protein LOC104787347 [Camelina sativa]